MKKEILPFNGFNKDIFNFFAELEKHNSLEWFQKNRDRYQQNIVEPTKSFIIQVAPFLNRLNPSIRTEPKFNETIMRINKDMRFAKGAPYRNFWLIHFGKFKLDSEFFLYFEASGSDIGLFINNSKGENFHFGNNIRKYKKEINEVFEKYKINNSYSFHYFKGMSTHKLISKFNADKHFDKLSEFDMFLLQKSKQPTGKTLFSDKIVLDMIKSISQLYPLYCFAVSPQPLKELNRFEEEFGEIVD